MIRNFLFHRVNPKRDMFWDPMALELFERCIKYISEHYKVVLIEDLVSSTELYTKNKFATIMFDDGYKDNIEYAAPILNKYNCKASFYLITECIEKNIPPWTYILDYTFQHTNSTEIDLPFDFLPTELIEKKRLTKNERLNFANTLKPFLKKISHEKRNLVLNKVFSNYSDVEIPKLMMTWNDIKELKSAGHYIGSHTATHSMLGTMTDEDEIRNELLTSANSLVSNLGSFPLTISYPVGSYNETTIKLCKETGYKIGLAVKQDTYNPQRDNIFEIPRIELYNEPWWKTLLRITNSLENIKKLIRYK